MEVMDVPVLSMHSPYEVSPKADRFTLYLGAQAFFAWNSAYKQAKERRK
jgi:aspartyl aminopeptidase